MIRLTRGLAALAAVLLLSPVSVFAQSTPTQTTLSAAITSSSATSMIVASATGFALTDSPSGEKVAMIDKELVRVRSLSGTVIQINRGWAGSMASTHASGATVIVSNPAAFRNTDSSSEGAPTAGSCTAGNEQYLPVYNYLNGRRWNCIGSTWMVDNGLIVLPAAACVSSVSGNGTGTNGLTTVGASVVPAMQAQTSATGTNTHTYICSLNATLEGSSSIGISRNISIIDAVFLYGVQTTNLGTQAAVLASGTLNGSIVFSKVAYPASGASETASTVTPVRADAGTLTITPVVGSFNVNTTTAGGFYSVKFTPATPIAIQTDLAQFYLRVDLLNTATSATITNSPGVVIHYAYIPD